MFKKQIVSILQKQAKRYIDKHQLKVVAVVGSVGKTSTKMAIATVLSQRYKVQFQEGNYNASVTVPLVIFGMPLPSQLKSPFAWFSLILQSEKLIRAKSCPVEVLVLELGADKPGDIAAFSKYLHPDIAVITAVAAEHMEFFKTMEAVAREELAIASFSALTIINRDDVDEDYAQYATTSSIDTYGLGGVAEYRFIIQDEAFSKGFKGLFISPELGEISATVHAIGEHNVKAAVAAGTVAVKLGLDSGTIKAGIEAIQPIPGRMQLLRGLEDSTLIDDTYNASPISMISALQTLYQFPTSQRIAILGSMNELGDFSSQAHEQVGKTCDGRLLDWVVTIGDDAERYLAPAAAGRGCQVRSFKSPYEAGGFVHKVMQPGSTILIKGSQNGVFAEEAVKILLHNAEDEEKLVRQSSQWLDKKNKQFTSFK